MAEAKRLINSYHTEKFGEEADFSNLQNVNLVFCTTGDGKHLVEVYADLINYSLTYLVDTDIVASTPCYNVETMCKHLANHLNFDEMVAFAEDKYAKKPPCYYAVIFNYSFDDNVAVYLFKGIEPAKDFLRVSYNKELRIDTEENNWNSVGEFSENGLYAKITTTFPGHENVTEMRVGAIHQ